MRALLATALLALLLPIAMPAHAATICCLCKKTGETEKSCLTAPQRTETTVDPVSRTTLAIPKTESCGSEWLQAHDLKADTWTCDAGLLSESQCKPVAENGVCQAGPLSVEDAKRTGEAIVKPTTTEKRIPAILPNLNVQIPGFAFTGADSVTKDTSSLLAQYVAGVYRYALSISAVVATIMFVHGAFQYLLGSALKSIASGKEIMMDAVMGLLLVFSATFILRTVNPDTLTLKALHIQGVVPGPFQVQRQQAANAISMEGCAPNPGASIPSMPMTCSKATVTGEMRTQALAVQQETGVPAYLLLAIYGNETGYSDKACPNNNCGGIKCTPPGGGPGWVPLGQTLECGANCALLQTKEDFHDGRGQIPVMACFKKFADAKPGEKYKSRLEKIANVLAGKHYNSADSSWKDYQGNPDCAASYIQKRGYATATKYADLLRSNIRDHCLVP
ncbi:MAG: hypothetical protein RL141_614 [Candidatus Parcubacteria bacterium]|jgi:hypothetical protein